MDYQNTDEATRREACERVKQIVKAIKAIKIKYYMNFSKMSGEDKQTYDKLEENLEKISTLHNLGNLKVALMQEVSDRYDGKPVKDMGEENQPEPDNILQFCYGAIDAQKEALSRGRITQAIRCQEQLKTYTQKLNPDQYQEVLKYKREKFAELMQTREQVETKIEECNDFTKSCYEAKEVLEERKKATDIFQGVLNKTQVAVKNRKEELLKI